MKIIKSTSKLISIIMTFLVVFSCISSRVRNRKKKIDHHFAAKRVVFSFLAKISHEYAYDAELNTLRKDKNQNYVPENSDAEKYHKKLLEDCSFASLPTLLADDINVFEVKEVSAKIITGNFHKFDDEEKQFFLVSLRGTNIGIGLRWKHWHFANLFTDLNAIPKDGKEFCEGCNVHMGFKNMFNGIIKDQTFKGILDNAITAKKTIVISGHSLGGALSNLLAAYILKNHPGIDVHLVTFGSPRIGNKAFANFLNGNSNLKTHIRFVSDNDFVTKVPAVLGYLHAGTEANIKKVKKPDGEETHVVALKEINKDLTGYLGDSIVNFLKLLGSKSKEGIIKATEKAMKATKKGIICTIDSLGILYAVLAQKVEETKIQVNYIEELFESKIKSVAKSILVAGEKFGTCVLDLSKFAGTQIANSPSHLKIASQWLANYTYNALEYTCYNFLEGMLALSKKKSRLRRSSKKLRDGEDIEINDPELKEVKMLLSHIRNHFTYKNIKSEIYLQAYEDLNKKINGKK